MPVTEAHQVSPSWPEVTTGVVKLPALAGQDFASHLAVVHASEVPAGFTKEELDQLNQHRRSPTASFYLGRLALKQAQVSAGHLFTPCIQLPKPGVSLSHAGEWAACLVSEDTAKLVGIDLEPWRDLPRESAQFFTTTAELNLVANSFEADKALLTLWSVKEALYKASKHPSEDFLHYQLTRFCPFTLSGEACQLPTASRFAFQWRPYRQVCLAVATHLA